MTHLRFINPKSPVFVALVLVSSVLLVSYGFVPQTGRYHGEIAGAVYRSGALTTSIGTYFTGSGNCVNCHDTDPAGVVLVDENGDDCSPVADWRATMMANSAKDPFWRAKVKHETLEIPNYAEEIENTCTTCHAPQGNREFHMTGMGDLYTMENLINDPLGLDGVACMGCHGIEAPIQGVPFNGAHDYSQNQVAYGNFPNPWSGPMIAQTGFSPAYSPHMGKSELCAGCHSLFTDTHDYTNEPTGNTFFEQSTYHEWLNSQYNEQGVECQNCHMPAVEGGAIISPMPNWLFPQPFRKHHFVGGNTFMLKLMQANIDALDIAANTQQYDKVIQRTIDMLQEQSLEAELVYTGTVQDSAVFDLQLVNKAGHKFPSGYPSRLIMVEFVLTDEQGTEVFRSGGFDADYNIIGRDADYELHHDVIRSEEQVQIYEIVMADVNDVPTTVLERAEYPLKDNRLVPIGYSSSHYTGDTTAIAGLVLEDSNFNFENGVEGSGSDRLQYRIKVPDAEGVYSAMVKIHYQSLPPRWMEEMFTYDAEEITFFKEMYEAADPTPVLVWEGSTDFTNSVDVLTELESISIGPNPCQGVVRVRGAERCRVRIFNATGELVSESELALDGMVNLPPTQGVYYLQLISKGRVSKMEKVLRL